MFEHVKNNGYLVISLRFTNSSTINNIKKSYQYISFKNQRDNEIALYNIFNIEDFKRNVRKLKIYITFMLMDIGENLKKELLH